MFNGYQDEDFRQIADPVSANPLNMLVLEEIAELVSVWGYKKENKEKELSESAALFPYSFFYANS